MISCSSYEDVRHDLIETAKWRLREVRRYQNCQNNWWLWLRWFRLFCWYYQVLIVYNVQAWQIYLSSVNLSPWTCIWVTSETFFGYIIVPQLSKCLKLEAVWGYYTDQMIWIWTKRYNKTHASIVVHRMARHNHIIDWYYLLSSFVKLMVTESLKSFT